jgi:hypothetical protein
MPYFHVFVEGKDIAVPMGDDVAVGFFTTRSVRAQTSDEAAEKVKSMITTDWAVGRYAAWGTGRVPAISVERVWQTSWISWLFFKNDGHTFYPDNEGKDEA